MKRLGWTSRVALAAVLIVVAVVAASLLLGKPYRAFFQLAVPSLGPPQPATTQTAAPEPCDEACRVMQALKRGPSAALIAPGARARLVTPPTPSPPLNLVDSPPPSSLDLQLKKLVQGNIAFNNPEKMQIGETEQIEAKLAVSVPPDELMGMLTAAGKRESTSLEVSDHMQATLTGGAAFDVSPTGPQSQWIAQDAPTTWHWLVTPKLTGPQFLTLSVDAIISINGDKDTRNITTLTRPIEVDVARPHNAEEWVAWIKDQGEAFGWGWGALAAVIAVVTGSWRRIRGWLSPRQRQSGSKGADSDHD